MMSKSEASAISGKAFEKIKRFRELWARALNLETRRATILPAPAKWSALDRAVGVN